VIIADGIDSNGINGRVTVMDTFGFDVGSDWLYGFDGAFAVGGIHPGNYKTVYKDRNSNLETWYPSAREHEDAQWIQVTEGQAVAGATISALEAPFRNWDTVSITGRCYKGSDFERPYSSGFVFLVGSSDHKFEVQPDSNGVFSCVVSAPPGRHNILVVPEGSFAPQWFGGSNVFVAPEDVSLTEDIENLTIHFAAGGSIHGFVLDEEGTGLPFERVAAISGNGFVIRETITKAGEFSLEGLPEGEYFVGAGREPYAVFFPNTRIHGDALKITASPGERTDSVIITVVGGMGQGPDPDAYITGSVRDQSGNPMADEFIYLKYTDPDPAHFAEFAYGWTDEKGTFDINVMSHSPFTMQIGPASDYYSRPRYFTNQDAFETPEEMLLEKGETLRVDIVLPDGGSVGGFVYDSQGFPLWADMANSYFYFTGYLWDPREEPRRAMGFVQPGRFSGYRARGVIPGNYSMNLVAYSYGVQTSHGTTIYHLDSIEVAKNTTTRLPSIRDSATAGAITGKVPRERNSFVVCYDSTGALVAVNMPVLGSYMSPQQCAGSPLCDFFTPEREVHNEYALGMYIPFRIAGLPSGRYALVQYFYSSNTPGSDSLSLRWYANDHCVTKWSVGEMNKYYFPEIPSEVKWVRVEENQIVEGISFDGASITYGTTQPYFSNVFSVRQIPGRKGISCEWHLRERVSRKASISIYTPGGRMIHQEPIEMVKGTWVWNDGKASGTYLVQFSSGACTRTVAVLVL